jgi:NAD(P)-dependent dehydrogenase (short-subunit alcohol dehydrogenase family)
MQTVSFFLGCFDNGSRVSRNPEGGYHRIVVRELASDEISNLPRIGSSEGHQRVLFWETCSEKDGAEGSTDKIEMKPALVFLQESSTGELTGRQYLIPTNEVVRSERGTPLTAIWKGKPNSALSSLIKDDDFDRIDFVHDSVKGTVCASFSDDAGGPRSSVLFSKHSVVVRDSEQSGDVILRRYEPGVRAGSTNVEIRRIAIVTGGGSGIGAGISDALARDGYNLVLGYNTNRTRCETWGKVLDRRYGATVVCAGGDIAKDETFNLLFSAVDKFPQGGKLVAAVHCAGQYIGITSENNRGLSASDNLRYGDGSLFDEKSKSVNFGPFNFYMDMYGKGFCALAERAASRMSAGAGYIVGITAPGCNAMTTPRAGTYDMPMAGKAVMEQMTRYYAKNLASRRITVNCISPGLTATAAWEKFAEHLKLGGPADAFIEKTAESRCPMKTTLMPSDIGNAAAFLCSPKARFISGVTLPVDGALHLIS